MVEEWVPWLVVGVALFIYCLMTLALRVIEPQGLSARLGLVVTFSRINLSVSILLPVRTSLDLTRDHGQRGVPIQVLL